MEERPVPEPVKTESKFKQLPKSILCEAIDIRSGSRNADYGDAVENFRKIAQMATLMTGKEITPEQCVAVQMAVKLCREGFNHKRDNLVDLCGYADIMQLIKEDGENAVLNL